jgi:hypothetical protein
VHDGGSEKKGEGAIKMNEIQETWLEKESAGNADYERGALALTSKIQLWVEHLQSEGIAPPSIISAFYELLEQIETWCGVSYNSNDKFFNDMP